MHSSTKKAAEPKRLTKNGKVYGDLLSAEEKKKLVLQKKKGIEDKESPSVCAADYPICGDVPRLHLLGQQPPLHKDYPFQRHQLPARPERGQNGYL